MHIGWHGEQAKLAASVKAVWGAHRRVQTRAFVGVDRASGCSLANAFCPRANLPRARAGRVRGSREHLQG
jgi:hypothetical protein